MPQPIPKTQDIKDQNVANFESKLAQTVPLNDKAFLRVLSAGEALVAASMYRYAAERVLQNFAMTATGDGLVLIGTEFGVLKKAAVATVLIFTLPGTNGIIIPAGTDFIGDSNGVRYFSDASATITGGFATITATAENVGVIGNLIVSDTLTIGTQVAGAENIATITVVDTTGADEEEEEAYRERVLFAIRSTTGGNNPTDYKVWAEAVAGVETAFPLGGKIPPATSYPGDRTIFVEAETSIHADGEAPASLLTSVRDAITTDPETNLARPLLGLSDSTLFVVSITRRPFYIEITNLDVASGILVQVKADIESALTTFFLSMSPFVDGIDLDQQRNDLVTDVILSKIVQDAIADTGGSVDEVAFGIVIATFTDVQYRLDPGEKAKLGSVTYAP